MDRALVRTTLLLLGLTAVGCQTASPLALTPSARNDAPGFVHVPMTVERLAILYPKTYNRELMDAYARLAWAAFQLKEQRPSLRIVERLDLPAIQGEQLFQLSGVVSDATAMSVGRLLGADSVLLYRIDGPTLRDRVLAKLYGELPPFTVTSKVVRVESAEVVYHNVVTTPVAFQEDSLPSLFNDPQRDPSFQTALERGIAKTISDLQRAFR